MSSVRTDTTGTPASGQPGHGSSGGSMTGRVVAAWTFVGIPLVYGVYETVKKASALF